MMRPKSIAPRLIRLPRDAEAGHAGDREEEGQRDGRRHDQGRAPVAEKDKQHRHDEHGPLEEVLLHRADGGIHEVGPVVLRPQHEARRQLRLDGRELCADAMGDGAAVLPRDHQGGADERFLAVFGGGARADVGADAHVGQVADRQRMHGSGELDRQGGDLGGGPHPADRTHDELFAGAG